MIEIDVEQRHAVSVPGGQFQNFRETTLQAQPVQQPRQRVMVSEMGEPILVVDELPFGALAG